MTRRSVAHLGRVLSITGLGAAALVACYDSAPPPDVAPSVDLGRFQGKWYEVAKLPRTTETDCTGTTATYALQADGSLELTSECHEHTFDGPLKSMTATAKVPDPKAPAKLALDIHGFYGDYWILEVGPAYEYAVVGHPSRAYLWILSRTPTLEQPLLDGILSRARQQNFDVERLEYTKQLP
jgi:apolipoprotein D and lipocalin family protein